MTDVLGNDVRQDFSKIARGDGTAIEEVITRVYGDLAATWSVKRLVIDGGAHMGYHTSRMGAVPNISRIIAIEANPKTYQAHANALKAAPHAAKVDLIQAALQDRQDIETISFTTSPTHPGRSGLNPIMALYDKKTEFAEPVSVRATTIDRLMAGANAPCGFIKLDLEGSEFAALRGGQATLTRDRPLCVLENGPDAPAHGGYSIEDFIAFMSSCGMTLTTVFGDKMGSENARDFWYAWAVPTSNFDNIRSLLTGNLQKWTSARQARA